MTTRYIYKSPISGRTRDMTLAQVLEPDAVETDMMGGLLAILVDKGYLALHEALQLADVPPGSVSVVDDGFDVPKDTAYVCRADLVRPSHTPAPPVLDTDAQFRPGQMVSNPVGDISVSALQHRQDVDWLIGKLQLELRGPAEHDLRIRRLQSFLREELLR